MQVLFQRLVHWSQVFKLPCQQVSKGDCDAMPARSLQGVVEKKPARLSNARRVPRRDVARRGAKWRDAARRGATWRDAARHRFPSLFSLRGD